MDEELLTEAGLGEPEIEEPVEHSQEESLFGGSTPETAPQRPAHEAAPLALYRRYRPDTFADVIGQEHVTEPLQRALTNNRVNHAYLFSGPRGCGKTTSARILARALNCEKAPIAEPCGECQSCRDLARGGPGSIDVIEIDAASHGGVDDARDLRERAFFAPVSSHYKIYIVDEAHMVTTAGFNALLKLVEEPPPHVKFIFATTEPDKVIGTIRSRTHHYPFRLVPPRVLTEYLGILCEAEGIAVEPAVLPLVVRAGAGSVRDSLSVLDQLLGGAGESGVEYRQATALLGYTPDSLLDEFVDAFAAGDAGGVFSCVDKVIEVGQDPRRFAEDLLRRLRDLVIVAAVDDALSSGLVEVAGDQAERLSSQAAQLGPGELTRAAEVIALGLTDMRGTTAPRLHLELMCARVLLPGADVDQRGVHARLDRLERRIGVVDTRSSAPLEPEVTPPSSPPLPVAPPDSGVVTPKAESSGSGRGSDQPTSSPSSPAANDTAANDTAPNDTAPNGTAPNGTAPNGTAPNDTAPNDTAPNDTAPKATAQQTGTRQASTPEATAPKPTRQATSASSSRPELASFSSAESDEQSESDAPTGPESGSSVPSAETAQTRPEPSSPPEPIVQPKTDPPAHSERATAAASSDLTVTDLRRLWPEVLEAVKGKRRFTWMLLSQNAQIAELRNNTLLLSMANTGARDHFSRGGSEDILKEAVTSVLGANFAIETMVDGTSSSTGGQRAHEQTLPETSQAVPVSPPSPDDVSTAPAARESMHRDQARQGIRPTRSGSETSTDEDRDAAARRDDSNIEETSESHTELLARHLGAEVIAEDDDSA